MTATYSDLQTKVTRRVIDLPSAVVAEVPRLVNIAMLKLQEEHNFRVMETEIAAFTLVNTQPLLVSVGGAAITIPGTYNFKEWRGEPWYIRYTDGSPRFMSMAPSRESLWGMFSQGGGQVIDTGYPQAILEEPGDDQGNRALSVWPVPDGLSDYSDGEYRITLPYYRYVPALVNAGDNNWFTNQVSGEEYIVRYAAAEGHALNWDYEKMAILKVEAKTHAQDLIKADKRFRLSAVREFVPHWRGAHQNKTRL